MRGGSILGPSIGSGRVHMLLTGFRRQIARFAGLASQLLRNDVADVIANVPGAVDFADSRLEEIDITKQPSSG